MQKMYCAKRSLAYEGTILFVSHDLDFVNKLGTRIVELTPKGAYSFPGTYTEFCDHKKAQQQAETGEKASKNSDEQKQVIKNSVSQQDVRALRKKMAELEKNIARLEQEQTKETEFLSRFAYGSPPYLKAVEKIDGLMKKLEEAQAEWEGLALKVDAQ